MGAGKNVCRGTKFNINLSKNEADVTFGQEGLASAKITLIEGH